MEKTKIFPFKILFQFLFLVKFSITIDGIQSNQTNFIAIGKDDVVPQRKDGNGTSIISRRVFDKDGIKYTEFVRKTASGGIQTSHIRGEIPEKPSLLNFPLPNLQRLLDKVQDELRWPKTTKTSQERNLLVRSYSEVAAKKRDFLRRVDDVTSTILDNVFEFLMGNVPQKPSSEFRKQ